MFNKLLFVYWKTLDLSYFIVDVLMVFTYFSFLVKRTIFK